METRFRIFWALAGLHLVGQVLRDLGELLPVPAPHAEPPLALGLPPLGSWIVLGTIPLLLVTLALGFRSAARERLQAAREAASRTPLPAPAAPGPSRRSAGHAPEGVSHVAPAADPAIVPLVTAALLLSGVGDVCLEWKGETLTALGVLAFGLAHVAYMAAWRRDLPPGALTGPRAAAAAVPCLALGYLVGGGLPAAIPTEKVAVLGLYAALLLSHVGTALVRAATLRRADALTAALGIATFALSDALIAAKPLRASLGLAPADGAGTLGFPLSGFAIMVTYLLGQWWLVRGALDALAPAAAPLAAEAGPPPPPPAPPPPRAPTLRPEVDPAPPEPPTPARKSAPRPTAPVAAQDAAAHPASPALLPPEDLDDLAASAQADAD